MKRDNNKENSFKWFLFVYFSNRFSHISAWSVVRVSSFVIARIFESNEFLCFKEILTVWMHRDSSKIVLDNFKLLICIFEVIKSCKHEGILGGKLTTFEINSVTILYKLINFDDLLKGFSDKLLIFRGQIKKFLPYSRNLSHFLVSGFFYQIRLVS